MARSSPAQLCHDAVSSSLTFPPFLFPFYVTNFAILLLSRCLLLLPKIFPAAVVAPIIGHFSSVPTLRMIVPFTVACLLLLDPSSSPIHGPALALDSKSIHHVSLTPIFGMMTLFTMACLLVLNPSSSPIR